MASHYFPQFERFLAIGPLVSGCAVCFGLETASPLQRQTMSRVPVSQSHVGFGFLKHRAAPPLPGRGYRLAEPLHRHGTAEQERGRGVCPSLGML